MWIISCSLGGKIEVFVKSLSRVISVLLSFFAWRAISTSGKEDWTRMQSWVIWESTLRIFTGTSSSTKNFIQKPVSGFVEKGRTLGFWRILRQSEALPVHASASIQDNNPARRYPQFSGRLAGALRRHKPVFWSPGSRAFHAELVDRRTDSSEGLRLSYQTKPNIAENLRQARYDRSPENGFLCPN